MRVLVVTDRIGPLGSARAGWVLADAWSAASCTVVPAGEAGAGFVTAHADQLGLPVTTWAAGEVVLSTAAGDGVLLAGASGPAEQGGGTFDPLDPGIPWRASSRPLGDAVAGLLGDGTPRRLVLDLAGLDVHDGGAGLLAALGATADRPLDGGVAALEGISRLDLGPVRDRLAGSGLVGVVPAAEVGSPLLGLRGITSRRGRGTVDPARMLQTDATLQRFAELAGGTVGETPGAGACGGIGLAVLALGGQLTSGPDLALAAVPDPPPFDLVVSGCTVFDFATRGGGVVAAAARVAAAALGPCIVVAGEVVIGAREMRTMGIEAAYPVRESSLDDPVGAVTEAEIAATARRVARSWTW